MARDDPARHRIRTEAAAWSMACQRPAIAHHHDPRIDEDVVEHPERSRSTLDPSAGASSSTAHTVEVREGDWPGSLVVIAFPSRADARGWYESPADAEIVHLRTDRIERSAILAAGVDADCDVRHTAAALRRC